jgi:hypothetical protein
MKEHKKCPLRILHTAMQFSTLFQNECVPFFSVLSVSKLRLGLEFIN